jgi:phosphomannomutase/phosphoglucomutase
MKVSPEIFRQYDVRGIYGQDLDESTAEGIGKAVGTMTMRSGAKKVAVGADNRISSEPLKKALINGLLSTGVDVIDIGTVISPVLYYSRIFFNTNSAVMITASHNPGKYNGFKICSSDGETLYGDGLQEVRKMIENDDFVTGPAGKVEEHKINNEFTDMITEKIRLGKRKLKVAVDCGNGTASFYAEEFLKKLGCEVIPIYCESDPTFPNHHPDPVKADNLKDLIKLTLENKADLGIGFDGDGDRIGVVDDKGNVIYGDQLMILYWREIMPKHPKAKAIVEVKCSQALADEIEKLGGEPIFYKTGHSLIKAKMKEIGAIFTGEMSGHMFFKDEYYGYDDALYAAGRLLRILSNSDKTMSELLSNINKYYSTPEIRLHTEESKKFQTVENVRAYFKQKSMPMIEVDGVRALFGHGWGLVRASNTGPELIVRCESNTPEGLDTIKQEMSKSLGMELKM